MNKVNCELLCNSNSPHLQMIYTGFRVLELQKKIRLSYQISKSPNGKLDEPAPNHLFVRLNKSILICFDMTDPGFIRTDALQDVDYYFKRSYSPAIINSDDAYKKVLPLGLHYCVIQKFPTGFSIRRAFLEDTPQQVLKSLLREFMGPMRAIHPRTYRLHIDNCFAEPDYDLQPKILFMVRLWDPMSTKDMNRSSREQINNMRVACVQKLRQNFGDQFIGGLVPNAFAKHNYPDLLIQQPKSHIFGNYIRLLRKIPIGIATTGLHGSIGGKFAEYVAFSHAIVSEKLNYSAPGLEPGKHYLEYETPDECIEMVDLLLKDKQIREDMMRNNSIYYQQYLKPDVLVWRAISTAIEKYG